MMRAGLVVLAVAATLGGCAHKGGLPADWARPDSVCRAIDGGYGDMGERGYGDGRDMAGSFHGLLEDGQLGIIPADRFTLQTLPGGRLSVRFAAGQLVTETLSFAATPDPTLPCAVQITPGEQAEANKGGLVLTNVDLSLVRGTDGTLMAWVREKQVGAVLLVAPVARSDSDWYRWQPMP